MIKARLIILLFSVVSALVLMSCAVKKVEGDRYVPDHLYDLSISYDREERAFLFYFTSHADDEICIPKMSWTNESGGHYFFGDRRIYIVNKGVRYDIKDLASGYCTPQTSNGCVHVVETNDQLFGKLPVEDFVVPPEVYLSKDFDPQLHYPYAPRFCTAE